MAIAHDSNVELVERTSFPKGVGEYHWVEPPARGKTVGNSFGESPVYVRFDNGHEGQVPQNRLKVLPA